MSLILALELNRKVKKGDREIRGSSNVDWEISVTKGVYWYAYIIRRMINQTQLERYKKLISFIDENFKEEINIEVIEEVCHYSYRNINRIFEEFTAYGFPL